MRGILIYLHNRSSSDSADSTVITTVLVWPILLMMMITMVEVPVFFENRNVLQNDLRSGSRTAATLGGVSTNTSTGSKLAATYGAANACSKMTTGTKSILKSTVVTNNVNGTDAVTCNTATQIATNANYIAFNVYDLTCGPQKTTAVGETTYCEASYNYTGIPGGSMSLIGGTQHFGWGTGGISLTGSTDGMNTSKSGLQYGHLKMSSQSDVCLSDTCVSGS